LARWEYKHTQQEMEQKALAWETLIDFLAAQFDDGEGFREFEICVWNEDGFQQIEIESAE